MTKINANGRLPARLATLTALAVALFLIVGAPPIARAITWHETKLLTAGPEVREWISGPLGNTVHIYVYAEGQELPQEYGGRCGARYSALGLTVKARMTNCRNPLRASRAALQYCSETPINIEVVIENQGATQTP